MPTTAFAKVRHARPMLSLDNAFTDEELQGFFDRAASRLERETDLKPDAEIALACEPKIDGLSISLRYEDGEFPSVRRAATARPARKSRPICRG